MNDLGPGRNHPHAASAASSSTAEATRAVRFRDGAAAAGTKPLSAAIEAAVAGSLSALTNASAVANRSAGSLASALCTAASTLAGTERRRSPSRSGSLVTTAAITAWMVGPVCGGSPASIS